ncbi:hypothetical protein [Lentzea terrae]|uniref:hypothetical protein n=1 Tax=Lentzea terrae TaxID=2200761 RepID=UPI001E29DB63|nr:hypothetical protein [Lentzea terrae]
MPLVHHVALGRSGPRVSPFALGAMTFGDAPGVAGCIVEESEMILGSALLPDFLSSGIRRPALFALFRAFGLVLLGPAPASPQPPGPPVERSRPAAPCGRQRDHHRLLDTALDCRDGCAALPPNEGQDEVNLSVRPANTG